MRLLFTILFITTFNSFAQLTGTISGTANVCQGAGGPNNITFTGFNGAAPYTFFYNINGGATQSITTISGNSISFAPSLGTPGVFNYNLINVQDATMAMQSLVETATLTVNPLPTVYAGFDQAICVGSTVTLSGSGALTYSWNNGVTNGIPFAPASSGIFTVIGSDANGCVNTDQMSVTVSSLPMINAGVDQTICYGTSVTLTGSGGAVYTWNNGVTNGVSFTPTSTTTFTVVGTSANGCTNSDQVVVTVAQLPIVNAGPDLNLCTGSALTIPGSGALTYNWSPATGLNSTNIANPIATPTVTTTYTLTGVSSMGCIGTDQITVSVLPIAPTPPTASIDSSICNDGMIQLVSSQTGTSIIWQNGSTSPQLTNLSPGTYSGNYTDGNGCTISLSYSVPLSTLGGNCPEITGSVFLDYDHNCTINGSDTPLENQVVLANPGNYLTLTDQDGNYSFSLPIGTYTIQQQLNSPSLLNGCTASYTVPLLSSSDSIGNINFMDTLTNPIDVYSTFYASQLVPGFNFIAIPQYYSVTPGIAVQSLNAWIKIPQGVTLLSWSYPYTQSNDTLYFSLSGYGSTFNTMSFVTSTSLPLGSMVTFCTGIEIVPGELNISNNIYCQSSIVTGAFDPNDKRMFLNGEQSDSSIYLTDQTLDYIIRFQNTGTAPAHNIYVLDTILSTLDLNTFQFVSSSHNSSVSILDGNVLKFNFPQIMLPDSTNNEPESHGFVHYRIRQNNQNSLGTVINNTAHIYFDFNEAVVTNTTYDIIVVDDLNLDEVQLFNVKLYPNPTESIVNIESENVIDIISVYSSNGQLVKQFTPTSQKATIDLSELNQGVYLLELNCEKGRIVKRIIVQ